MSPWLTEEAEMSASATDFLSIPNMETKEDQGCTLNGFENKVISQHLY